MKNKEIKEKGKKTKLEKYGDENYNNKEKYKETCQKKYGVDYALSSNIVRDKIKETVTEGSPSLTILADNSTSFNVFDKTIATKLKGQLQEH